MAGKRRKKALNQNFDKAHLAHTDAIKKKIASIYNKLCKDVGVIAELNEVSLAPDQQFKIGDYPAIENKVNELVNDVYRKTQTAVVNGINDEWELANDKNDSLCDDVLEETTLTTPLPSGMRQKYYNANTSALSAFLTRKENGMNLSQRLWKYTDDVKHNIEAVLELGIKSGSSSAEIARDLKQYLTNPDKLFRRVRDANGNLQLSKNAREYHPGQGVYRSAYKNALRVAVTETNMAYDTADHLRVQNLDFVVGIEIRLSNNHTCLGKDGKPHAFHDICDELAGKYPKTFKFVGWHPFCRCISTTILKTDDEIIRDMDGVDRGSVNEVKDYPAAFKQWVTTNQGRIYAAEEKGTLPYFIDQNRDAVRKMLNPEAKDSDTTETEKPSILERAAARHAARTQEDIDAIQNAWKEHRIREYQYKVAVVLDDCAIKDYETIAYPILRNIEASIYKSIGQGKSEKAIQALLSSLQAASVTQAQANTRTKGKLASIITELKYSGIKYNPVYVRTKKVSPKKMIARLSGGDETDGSCSSLALAYAGNKNGYDVLDYRDGDSRRFFASKDNIREFCEKVGGIVEWNKNDFSAANNLFKNVQQGHEYYFACGKHAAIIRRNNNKIEFLELQDPDYQENTFKELTSAELKSRFGAQKSHTFHRVAYDASNMLIDIDSLAGNSEFKEILGYINTPRTKQKKGRFGSIR